MRKLFLSMLLSCFLVMNMNVLHAKENTQDAIAATLKSKDVIVMNRDTKEILFAKNIKKRIYPASMTKQCHQILRLFAMKLALQGY